MLDVIHPWGRALCPALAAHFTARVASEPWELDGYWRLRAAIFAGEQALFEGSDVDEEDARAIPIVAESLSAGMPECVVGVVRIYEAEGRTWYGGRLGVDRDYRHRGAIGTALITQAVRTAHALGCVQFLATVQERNARYFERHRFRPLEPVRVRGRPHVLMQADLDAYPPASVGLETVHGARRREVA